MMIDVPSLFGSMVFNDAVMRARLPRDTYLEVKRTISCGSYLELGLANVVANAMKDWALEKGATHFSHWFQPMTGVTAEKHDSFITPTGDGRVILEFSGSALVRGEPDASSFPSGGLRATFEARGYTVWDASSYAFVKDGTLFIPTAFCAYNGEALDKKTPLLRSMEAFEVQAHRILRLFGKSESFRVITPVGPEQEYFLLDKEMYRRRPDLLLTGRTLFGAAPSKGQEDHYYGSIKPRIAAFMRELEQELWRLGVTAKTKHNESAPAQYELATVFATGNVACDHNQLTMELMKNIADRHGMVCLLHEKPFAGVNGSGKHINWSISTDKGHNLLEPGDTPHENAQFLLFMTAVIAAVDEYQDLLRLSAASAGNDHRLGGFEAPPTIISMYLGDELTAILDAIMAGKSYSNKEKEEFEVGTAALPHFPKDSSDRNRTSPMAFTGDKFEFRMLGSAFSAAGPIIVLNTIVAEQLNRFAELLENSQNFKEDLFKLIQEKLIAHKRIIYKGNNYAEEWFKEAKIRGLSNHKTTVDALPAFINQGEVFIKHQVFTDTEIASRYEIILEGYCRTIQIEALTMLEIVKGQIIPACISYQNELAELINQKSKNFNSDLETHYLNEISKSSSILLERQQILEKLTNKEKPKDILNQAKVYSNKIAPAMSNLRQIVDKLETLTSKKHWPLPSYSELLYSIV